MVLLLIETIAWIEVAIGAATLTGIAAAHLFGLPPKEPVVFGCVVIAAWLSTVIGCGLFGRREWARRLIVFFSGYIILTKVLLFAGVIAFKGEIIVSPPADVKNVISMVYHLFLIVFFEQRRTREVFRAKP